MSNRYDYLWRSQCPDRGPPSRATEPLSRATDPADPYWGALAARAAQRPWGAPGPSPPPAPERDPECADACDARAALDRCVDLTPPGGPWTSACSSAAAAVRAKQQH